LILEVITLSVDQLAGAFLAGRCAGDQREAAALAI